MSKSPPEWLIELSKNVSGWGSASIVIVFFIYYVLEPIMKFIFILSVLLLFGVFVHVILPVI